LAEFLHVITTDQFTERLSRFPRLSSERVSLDDSWHRNLAEDVVAPEDLPVRARSTVDGYAVRAEDTFGASDAIPALLEVVAAVEMGAMPDFVIRAGQAAQIPTGGFLPEGADAVVMVEYTNPVGGHGVEIMRPLAARTNVLEKGEDVRTGEGVVSVGRTLRPYEIGLLAALGIKDVAVYRRPRVAIISTGDEVVAIERTPQPGQIRDANAHSIAALVRAAGGKAIGFDIVPDSAGKLRAALDDGLAQADIVALSGGSSVGTRDLVLEVVAGLPGVEVLAHGVAIRPGKPTLLADRKGMAIFGLPGHPVSALIVAQVFLIPFLKYLQGDDLKKGPLGRRLKAVLSTSIHSSVGLEEFVRVRLEDAADGGYCAHPVFGKSGMLSTMVRADGIVVVPMRVEGIAKGEIVEVVEI
jgi:molybdopterin molybdotransferase